jgi:hypothetical protein
MYPENESSSLRLSFSPPSSSHWQDLSASMGAGQISPSSLSEALGSDGVHSNQWDPFTTESLDRPLYEISQALGSLQPAAKPADLWAGLFSHSPSLPFAHTQSLSSDLDPAESVSPVAE